MIVALAIYNSNSYPKRAIVQDALLDFIETLKENDLAAVIEFGADVRVRQQFTSDMAAPRGAVTTPGSPGGRSLCRGIQEGLKAPDRYRSETRCAIAASRPRDQEGELIQAYNRGQSCGSHAGAGPSEVANNVWLLNRTSPIFNSDCLKVMQTFVAAWRLIVTYLAGTRGYAQSVARNHRSSQERVWRNCWFVNGFRPLRGRRPWRLHASVGT